MDKAFEISIIPILYYIVLCIEVIKIENCLNQCWFIWNLLLLLHVPEPW